MRYAGFVVPGSSLARAGCIAFLLADVVGCADAGAGRDPGGLVRSEIGYGEVVTTTNARAWAGSVAIIHDRHPVDDGTYGGRCTALLITPRLLLTASHCGDTPYASFFEYDESGGTRSAVADIDVETRFDFEHDTANNEKIDISLRKLVEPAPVAPYWYPLSNTTESLQGTTIEVGGFGRTETGATSNELRQGLECSVSRDVWTNAAHGGVTPDQRFDYDCTYPQEETSPESGDSGAPVFTAAGEVVGIHTNSSGDIGIAQYLGYAVADGSRPYLDWIYSVIAAEDPDYYAALVRRHLGLPAASSEADVLGRFAVFGQQAVRFYDRASIDLLGDENDWSWGGQIDLAKDVECGAVLSGTGGAVLGERASVAGDLFLTGGQVLQQDAQVVERQVYLDIIGLPDLGSITWDGPANPTTQDLNIPAGGSINIVPGTYHGNLTIQPGAELNLLGCGKFYMAGLVIDPQAVLRLTGNCGPTQLNVRTTFSYSGVTEVAGGGSVHASDLLVGAWSDSTAAMSLHGSFVGTLLAPHGTISVRAGQTLTGAALAARVDLFPDARVVPQAGGMARWFALNSN